MHEEVTVGQSMKLSEDRGTRSMHEVTVGKSMKMRKDLGWGTPSMYEEVTVG